MTYEHIRFGIYAPDSQIKCPICDRNFVKILIVHYSWEAADVSTPIICDECFRRVIPAWEKDRVSDLVEKRLDELGLLRLPGEIEE